MKLVVWGINYQPELTGIAPFNTGLCDFLRERGHQVEMVTAFPYYPFWKRIPGDRGRLYRVDELDGVIVHRCWHHVPSRVTTFGRIFHELTFGMTSLLKVLFLARPDVYIVVSPPLLLGPLASFVCWLKRRPYVFHVQDLQPDAAVGLGMVEPGAFTRLLYQVEAWSYRHAAVVSGISESMIAAFARKGVPKERRLLFPNWLRRYAANAAALESEGERVRRAEAFRKKFSIPAGTFVASYSGNLGRKQGLETLVKAAKLLSERSACRSGAAGARMAASHTAAVQPKFSPVIADETAAALTETEILILIVGDGVMRRELEAQVADSSLKNVRLMPLLQEQDYQGLLSASDVSLILQTPGSGLYFLPSKLLSILSARSPVISAADDDSELAKAVAAGGFGLNVPPASPAALAEAITGLAAKPERLEGMRNQTEWVRQFAGETVLAAFEARLKELVQGDRLRR